MTPKLPRSTVRRWLHQLCAHAFQSCFVLTTTHDGKHLIHVDPPLRFWKFSCRACIQTFFTIISTHTPICLVCTRGATCTPLSHPFSLRRDRIVHHSRVRRVRQRQRGLGGARSPRVASGHLWSGRSRSGFERDFARHAGKEALIFLDFDNSVVS